MSKNPSSSRHASSDNHSQHSAKEKESHTMSTKSSTTPHVESAVLAVTSAPAPATTGNASPPAATAAATASPPVTTLVTVALPPAEMVIPAPPADYSPATPGEFRTVIPRKAELACLPQALIDLSSFTGFDQTMGALAPTQAELVQAITAGAKWSSTRQATANWDDYASLMEGLAWQLIRSQLETLRPAFALAVKRNPKIAEQYAGLAKLLAVPATAAATATATKIANKKAIAEGKPPTHGKVGKQRQRKAEKAALVAGNAVTAAPPTSNGASSGGTSTPAQASVAPSAQGSAAPVAAGANGVSHS